MIAVAQTIKGFKGGYEELALAPESIKSCSSCSNVKSEVTLDERWRVGRDR